MPKTTWVAGWFLMFSILFCWQSNAGSNYEAIRRYALQETRALSGGAEGTHTWKYYQIQRKSTSQLTSRCFWEMSVVAKSLCMAEQKLRLFLRKSSLCIQTWTSRVTCANSKGIPANGRGWQWPGVLLFPTLASPGKSSNLIHTGSNGTFCDPDILGT